MKSNWDKLNDALDVILNSMTDKDWKNWAFQQDAASEERRIKMQMAADLFSNKHKIEVVVSRSKIFDSKEYSVRYNLYLKNKEDQKFSKYLGTKYEDKLFDVIDFQGVELPQDKFNQLKTISKDFIFLLFSTNKNNPFNL